jgi:hypothetical protein
MATKPQQKKKMMTLEDLATAIQRDFTRMATKDDIAVLRKDGSAQESDEVPNWRDFECFGHS